MSCSQSRRLRGIQSKQMLSGHRCGEIKRLVMGLDRVQKTPCGFCFVEYYTHQDALDCMKYIGGTKLDERIIRTDLDPGFQEGRQYGYVHVSPRRWFGAYIVFQGVASQVDRSAMSTGKNLIQVGEVMVAQLIWNVRRRKRSMGRVGDAGWLGCHY